jgi:hypothetical protein
MSITDDAVATADGSNDDTTTSSTSVGGGSVKTTTAAPPPMIDLLTCQPDELASWLTTHRFQNNAMDVASFLLTCTAALPNAEEISAHLMGGGEEDEEATDEQEESKDDTTNDNGDDVTSTTSNNNLGEPIASFSSQEVSCINPRGKFVLSLHSNGIMLTNPKKDEEQITIPKAAVEHAVWFRKPEDYKSLKQLKEGSKKPIPGHMILVCLEDGITFRNKAIQQICLQLPSYPAGEADSNEEDWYTGLSSALLAENRSITRVLAKMDNQSSSKTKNGEFMFQAGLGASGSTSTTTASFPYVGCNRGFNNGALFPLREGLLFFKPPLFVPRSNLASISCGRGSGQSRFVDMVVQLVDDDSTLEFTNIERDELQGLNQYIHSVLIPAMKQDAAGGSDNAGEEDGDGDEDEDVAMAEVVNSSDEDSNSDNESSAKCKRKSSRAASKSAREATRAHFAGLNGDDDDDEDSDAESFNEGEDDSDGSDEEDDSGLSDSEEVVSDDNDESGEEERSDDSDDDDGSFDVERSSKRTRVD